MMNRASDEALEGDAKCAIVVPEPSLPCKWQQMLRAWHARRETLISALCVDVIDEIALLCGPCQTRDQIDAFDLPLRLMHSPIQRTRWTALKRVPPFPASLWAVYGLVPTLFDDIRRALASTPASKQRLPSQALSAFYHCLRGLGARSKWNALLLASNVLDVTIQVLLFCQSCSLANPDFVVELLDVLDVFLEDSPLEESSHQRWWHYCRHWLVSPPHNSLHTLHCFYVTAARPHRHALLTTEQWAAVVPCFLHPTVVSNRVSLALTACARLLRSHNGVVQRLLTSGYLWPRVDGPPATTKTTPSDQHGLIIRRARLEFIRCAAERLGKAPAYADDVDIMSAVVGQFCFFSLCDLAADTLLVITREATTFVKRDYYERFVADLIEKHLSHQPRPVLSIIINCIVDDRAQGLRVFADNKYVDRLAPLLTHEDVHVVQEASCLLAEIQAHAFGQFLGALRPMVAALGQQDQEHENEDTSTLSVVNDTRFAAQALVSYLDEALSPHE